MLLIDTDKSGKISKQEWMKFMEAEFDRLDKDKKGQLDAKELEQSKLRVSHPVHVGKSVGSAPAASSKRKRCSISRREYYADNYMELMRTVLSNARIN